MIRRYSIKLFGPLHQAQPASGELTLYGYYLTAEETDALAAELKAAIDKSENLRIEIEPIAEPQQ